jgi:purine-binding chemotaxis protein CheW
MRMSTLNEALTEQATQYLSFSFGGSEYGVSILQVKEILQYDQVTVVPGTPASVRGVINLRGTAIPILDLGVKLGRPEVAVTNRTCVLVVEANLEGQPLTLGLIADEVNEVVTLRGEEVLPPPTFGPGVKLSYLEGVARSKSGRGFLLLLDLGPILSVSDAELLALSQAAESAEGTSEAAVCMGGEEKVKEVPSGGETGEQARDGALSGRQDAMPSVGG